MTKQLSTNKSYPNALKVWLYIGLFMLLVQVVVGGITRLTGSGLSITKWEIVTGTLNKAGNLQHRKHLNFQILSDLPPDAPKSNIES